jgi:hypothetical protein
MTLKPVLVGITLLALAGCMGHRPKVDPQSRLDPLTTCPKKDPCDKVANRRQYYDQRVARYYYFDTRAGRYYWENGQPRFPE